MADPTLHGAAYSGYVRAVRMALAEKGVAYALAPMFALFPQTPEGAAMLPRHPRLAAWWTTITARASFIETIP